MTFTIASLATGTAGRGRAPADPVSPPASRIEVLGPVRAWREGRELPLGPPQQREVLALLAVAAGRSVPTTEVVEALWGLRPPRTAVNVVQTYLKRLRRVLEPDRPARRSSQVLPSTPDGYALRSEPYTVDLVRFRQLAQLARQAGRAADPGRVVALLGEAFGLWQGPPGGDLPALASHNRIRAVLEEHRALVGLFAEAALAAGAPAQALPAVAEAAGAQPLDESLQADLIRLYHATGRRADAVRVYLGTRQRLRDELGLDPGHPLTAAYQDLLRISGPAAAPTGRTGTRPPDRTGPGPG